MKMKKLLLILIFWGKYQDLLLIEPFSGGICFEESNNLYIIQHISFYHIAPVSFSIPVSESAKNIQIPHFPFLDVVL